MDPTFDTCGRDSENISSKCQLTPIVGDFTKLSKGIVKISILFINTISFSGLAIPSVKAAMKYF